LDVVDEGQLDTSASRMLVDDPIGCRDCHDHKFDSDTGGTIYYALAGILKSTKAMISFQCFDMIKSRTSLAA